MLTTLLESQARPVRRTGGATISAIVHGSLIAFGVALTAREPRATIPPQRPPEIIFVSSAPRRAPVLPPTQQAPTSPVSPPLPAPLVLIPVPSFTPTSIPPIVAGTDIPPEQIAVGGLPRAGVVGTGLSRAEGTVVDVAEVERTPALLGQPRQPRYPSVLRESGTTGTVILRFVIDTAGRAEMAGLEVVESSHALFTDAVLHVLRDYRFSPGEVGGRRVRTMVQMPFVFTVNR